MQCLESGTECYISRLTYWKQHDWEEGDECAESNVISPCCFRKREFTAFGFFHRDEEIDGFDGAKGHFDFKRNWPLMYLVERSVLLMKCGFYLDFFHMCFFYSNTNVTSMFSDGRDFAVRDHGRVALTENQTDMFWASQPMRTRRSPELLAQMQSKYNSTEAGPGLRNASRQCITRSWV